MMIDTGSADVIINPGFYKPGTTSQTLNVSFSNHYGTTSSDGTGTGTVCVLESMCLTGLTKHSAQRHPLYGSDEFPGIDYETNGWLCHWRHRSATSGDSRLLGPIRRTISDKLDIVLSIAMRPATCDRMSVRSGSDLEWYRYASFGRIRLLTIHRKPVCGSRLPRMGSLGRSRNQWGSCGKRSGCGVGQRNCHDYGVWLSVFIISSFNRRSHR